MWTTFREFLASTDAPAAVAADVWDDVVGIEDDATPELVQEMRDRLAARSA